MADNVPLGMEFMRWGNLPSITQTIMGGKNPLFNALGIALAGSGEQAPEGGVPAPALGQGISVGGGVGVAPAKPSGMGIAPSQFAVPSLKLPQIGQPISQPAGQQGVDADGDGQIDSFWGLKK